MSNLYFYTQLSLEQLGLKLKAHQEEFELLLGDTFSDEQLEGHEALLEELAPPIVQPILEDLTFEDLPFTPQDEDMQRVFFLKSRSCLFFENLPLLEANPFQVTYLVDLLWMLDDVLVDDEIELCFKRAYLEHLKGFSFLTDLLPPVPAAKAAPQVEVTDPTLKAIYGELARLQNVVSESKDWSEKTQLLYELVLKRSWQADELLRTSGMNPKDFGDNLEKLKFALRRIS